MDGGHARAVMLELLPSVETSLPTTDGVERGDPIEVSQDTNMDPSFETNPLHLDHE